MHLVAFDLHNIELIDCYDGDTCKFNILDNDFPKYLNPMLVRVLGVDTPEMKGKHTNKIKAKQAREFTLNFIKNSTNFKLSQCIKDKYFRFDCNYISNNKSLSNELIKEDLGKPYFGGKKI